MIIESFFRPTTLDEAFAKYMESPKNQILGGGAWLKLTGSRINTLISLEGLGLDKIVNTEDKVIIGANATLRGIETDTAIKNISGGILSMAMASVMGVTLRNIATIGGTIMGRYPFSDVITALLALDATLVFYSQKNMKISEYLNQEKPEKDLLMYVQIDKSPGYGYFHRVARTSTDFAIVNLAIVKTGNIWRIAVGARPGIARLCPLAAEAMQKDQNHTKESLAAVAQMAVRELEFLSNNKASGEYREMLARTYVERGLEATCTNAD